MTTLTIKIPEGKTTDVSKFVKNISGEIITSSKSKVDDDDDEVTHGVFFGENIRRVIKAFSNK